MGILAMVAVFVPVFGVAKILGLGTDTWGGALIAVALLLVVAPFGIAAMSAGCRRYADRLVK